MNGIQGTKSAGQQQNRLLYAVVTIIKYKKINIDHAIYIKVFSDRTLSYLTVSTDDVLSTTNNKTAFTELTRVFEEHFMMKLKEGSVLEYLNFQIFQSTLGFSVDNTDQIMELLNEWFPTGNFRKVDTPFRTDSTYEKELMAALTLTGNALHKAVLEYHEKSGHTIGRMQHIGLMSRTDICYATFRLATQIVAPTLPGFQGTNPCVKYLDSHPHKPIFYPYSSYYGYMDWESK